MNDFDNPLNSFAVISFNNDDLKNVRFEYLNIGKERRVLTSNPRTVVEDVDNDYENNNLLFLGSHKNNEERIKYYNYWVLNNGEEFIVSAVLTTEDPMNIENMFSGPFLTEFSAKKFIEEMKAYLNTEDGI